jgi:hypothetical protein
LPKFDFLRAEFRPGRPRAGGICAATSSVGLSPLELSFFKPPMPAGLMEASDVDCAAEAPQAGLMAIANVNSPMSSETWAPNEMGALLGDVAATIHAHPTLTEAFLEAQEETRALRCHPLPNRSNSRAMLSVAHHSLGEPGESVEAKRSRTEPAGKRVAQACDRLLEPALRA